MTCRTSCTQSFFPETEADIRGCFPFGSELAPQWDPTEPHTQGFYALLMKLTSFLVQISFRGPAISYLVHMT